jgi:uncharacterized protein
MKKLEILAGLLLVVGGLNWRLVAIDRFDLVAWIAGLEFGHTNIASRIVYGLVGLAAVYELARYAAARPWSRTSGRPALGGSGR